MPAAALTRLRDILLGLGPSGVKGFEGLVALALGHLTGQSFKVAKSGRQVGDAHSTHVAVECKLYQDSTIPQDNLIAKLTRAEAAGADLWVVATTAEIRHPDNEELEGIGDKHGIAVGFLDWPPLAPLPPLAVLLATQPVEVSRFLETHGGAVAAHVCADLATIAAAAAFADEYAKLAKTFNPAHMGYAQARAACNGWLRNQLTAEGVSGNGLGQRANVASPNGRLVRRDQVMDRLNKWWANWTPDESRVLLLGLEGMGKTWAALSWWADNANDMPLTVTIMARHYAGGSAGHAIADAIARQVGEIPEKAQDSWLTKIKLWLKGEHAEERPRILLILDGLNENPGAHWSRLLSDLCDSPYRRLVATQITCRPQFWRDHVAPATKRSEGIPKIEVGEYTLEELKRALELNGLTGKTFAPALMEHLRKPRLFRIAAAHLDLAEGDITVARLIYRDWADRRGSKPGAIPLTEKKFETLVQYLAREAREALRQGADKVFRDPVGTLDHSQRDVVLSEIVEGGLMMRCRSGYKFPPVHLEYGLGLVLKDDALLAWEECPNRLDGVIAGYMDPLRGLPQEAAILRAAASLALFDEECPDAVRFRLHKEWLRSQNLQAEDARTIEAHVPANPGLFADLLEWAWCDAGGQATETGFLLKAFEKTSGLPMIAAVIFKKCEQVSRRVEKKIADCLQNADASKAGLLNVVAEDGNASRSRRLSLGLASLLWEHSVLVPILLRAAMADAAGVDKLMRSAADWLGRRPRFERQHAREASRNALASLLQSECSEGVIYKSVEVLNAALIHGDNGWGKRELPADNEVDPDFIPSSWSRIEPRLPEMLMSWWHGGTDLPLLFYQRTTPGRFATQLDKWLSHREPSAQREGGEPLLLCAQILKSALPRLKKRWRELRSQNSSENERELEARLTVLLLLSRSPEDQLNILAERHWGATWHPSFGYLIGQLPGLRSAKIARGLANIDRASLLPALRYLATQRPELDHNARRNVAHLACFAQTSSIRAAALNVAVEWCDKELDRMVVDGGWSWRSSGMGGGEQDDKENVIGAQCLGRCSEHLSFDHLAQRLPPRELAWAVAQRGYRADELDKLVGFIEAAMESIRRGNHIEHYDVPADLNVLRALRAVRPGWFSSFVDATLGPLGEAFTQKAADLVYALCEIVLAEDAPLGGRLWQLLAAFAPPRRTTYKGVQTNALDFLLASAPDHQVVRSLWENRLDHAKTDAELLDIAVVAGLGGKQSWLAEAIGAGLAEDGWRKARAFVLAGFDDDRGGRWDAVWGEGAKGWVGEARDRARAAHLRNYRAWRWFCSFLDHVEEADSWVSHRLFLHTVDRRHQLWLEHEITARGERIDLFRLKCHNINRQALVKAVENWEKEYGARYLGHTIPFGSVWPWLG